MTNARQEHRTIIDIRESADQVVAMLRRGQSMQALQRLEEIRHVERSVVQESLDRFVAAGAGRQLHALRSDGQHGQDPFSSEALARLQIAEREPRLPVYNGESEPGDLQGLSRAQRYDIYASIAEVRGSQAVGEALRRSGEAVLLGLRRENSSLVSGAEGEGRAGTGVYDDHIVALYRGEDGARDLYIAYRANTEPTAQYDHHAGSDGTRRIGSPTGPRSPVRATTPGFEEVVAVRHIEGRDADSDGTYDLGRLEPGSIEMVSATHGADGHFALRPSADSTAQGRGQVRRDSNGDGYFNAGDPSGLDDLNPTFKVHRGGTNNTYSAGCQTLHPDDYRGFMAMVRSNPAQTRWQYVLTHTTEGIFRNVHAGQRAAADAAPDAPPLRRQPGADPERQQGAPQRGPEGGGPQAGRWVPRTADDDYLERFLAATDRGDHAGRAGLTLAYAQRPEVRELDQLARGAVASEREQAQAAQERAWQADALRQSPQAMALGG